MTTRLLFASHHVCQKTKLESLRNNIAIHMVPLSTKGVIHVVGFRKSKKTTQLSVVGTFEHEFFDGAFGSV